MQEGKYKARKKKQIRVTMKNGAGEAGHLSRSDLKPEEVEIYISTTIVARNSPITRGSKLMPIDFPDSLSEIAFSQKLTATSLLGLVSFSSMGPFRSMETGWNGLEKMEKGCGQEEGRRVMVVVEEEDVEGGDYGG